MKTIEIHNIDISSSLPLPYADECIRAGLPSPAQDYMEQAIDKPAHVFYERIVSGLFLLNIARFVVIVLFTAFITTVEEKGLVQ